MFTGRDYCWAGDCEEYEAESAIPAAADQVCAFRHKNSKQ